MSDSDAPLFRDRPDWDSPVEEPLGLKNPLLPARSLGLNQRFLVPLGAQSLSVLDAAIFQSDRIQRDILDSPFHDSPFFSDADLTSISVGAISVDTVSVDAVSSQAKKAQDAIQLQQSPATPLGSTSPQSQALRNGVSQSEEMQGQRSPLPSETQQSDSELDIQRSPDKAFAPSSKNISESPDQPQQSTSQSNKPPLNVEATQQTSSGGKEQSSFSETSQIKETQPSSQPLQAEAEIQLSEDKISSLSSDKVSGALMQPQKSISRTSEPELDFKPKYRSTSSEDVQLFASSENKIQTPQTLQSSDQATQSLQEISLKQSSDASIQPQQLSSQVSSLELNNLEPNSLKIDSTSIQQINTQQTDVSENSQSYFAAEINLESPQSVIQPSRSLNPSTSESTFGQSNSSLELSASLETSLLDLNQTSQALETTQSNTDIQATAIVQPAQDNLLRSSIEPTTPEPLSIKPLVTNFIAETQPQPIQAKFETDELLLQQDLQTTQIDNSNTLLIPNNDVSDVSSENIQRFASEAIAPQQTDDVKTSEATLALSSISAEPARSSEFVIQPSRSPSSPESSPLDSTQPVRNFDIAEQPNLESSTSNLEQGVPGGDVSSIQKSREHDEIALVASTEISANPPLQTANEIIQPKIIVSNNSANDEILTNIDNTFQQSASDAIASPSPVDSIARTPSKSQLENNEAVLQQSPISVQAQALETTEIKLNLANATPLTEAKATEVSLEKNLEATIKPIIQTAEESAIAPKFDLQSIENLEAAQPSLDSISTENVNSLATTQTYLNDLSDYSLDRSSTASTPDPTVPNQLSESALSKSPRLENVPAIQPQLAENGVAEIGQPDTTSSSSSEELEVSAPSTRSLSEPTISLQPATQGFSSTTPENLPIDNRLPLGSLDQPVDSTSSLSTDVLAEPTTQTALEAVKEPMLQPQLETITTSDELSSPIEQLSSEEMSFSTEVAAEISVDENEAIAPLVTEVNPVISRVVDLPSKAASSEDANAEISSESQAELLQLKALTESTTSLDTASLESSVAQSLNQSSDAVLNLQAQEDASNQISTNEVQQLSRAVDHSTKREIERSQSSFEQAQSSPRSEQVIPENSIALSDPAIQELQLNNNESIQKTSEAVVVNQSVIPTEPTEIGDRAANQTSSEITIDPPLATDLASSQVSNSAIADLSVRETQQTISDIGAAQPVVVAVQKYANAPNTQLNPLEITSTNHLESAVTLQPTLEIASDNADNAEETIQRTIQQSEVGFSSLEEQTQQAIQNSQIQVDSVQTEAEQIVQQSPTSENVAIAPPTQTQIIQVKTSELPTLESDFIRAENSNLAFINQPVNPQITSEPSVNQMIGLKRDRTVQTDVANLMQPNTSVEQPTTIIQAKPDIQPNQAIDDRAPSAIDIQSLVQKAITEPAAIQPKQTTDNRMLPAEDAIINPDLFQEQTIIPDETAIARKLDHSTTSAEFKSIEFKNVDEADQLINQRPLDETTSFLNPPNLLEPVKPALEPIIDPQIQRQFSHDSSRVNSVPPQENQAIEINSSTEKIQCFVDNSIDNTAIDQNLTSSTNDASDTSSLNQQVNFERSQIIDVPATSTPSIHPSEHPFDVASTPETPVQRSLESLAPELDDSVMKPSPESIPQVPQVLQNLTVLRSLTQPQPLGGSDPTVQAKSLESQSLQATPRQATDTTNPPLVSAIPTANVLAASSIEQSVLNRKPEPVKVAATSRDRLSRQWSTLNELVQGQTVPSRRTSVAKTASSQKPSSAKVTHPTIQAKFSESSTPVRVTRQSSPTIRREEDELQDEDFDNIDYLEALAQAIYDRLRQRMRIDQERHGRDYSGRLPW